MTSAFGAQRTACTIALFRAISVQIDAERLKNMQPLRAIPRHSRTASNGVRCPLSEVGMMVGIDAD